jgi:hypothetical protein
VTVAAKATYHAAVSAEAIEGRFFVVVVLKTTFLESLERKDVALCGSTTVSDQCPISLASPGVDIIDMLGGAGRLTGP